ncbi:MAG: carbohydrate kinase family protein [Alphaproteobacteria bacterium]|nr:carbohydrate kinase family protein [Alphaproteobacteria bacterium]
MGFSITIIGAATMDISAQAAPHADLLQRDSHPGRITTSPGGVARNIAENLGRMGCAPTLITALGDDAFSAMITSHLAEAGVDYSASPRFTGECDRYLSWHDPSGDMTRALHQINLIDGLTPALITARANPIQKADLVVLDSNLAPATIDAIVAIAEAAATPPLLAAEAVSAFKCPRLRPHLKKIDLIKCNQLEASALINSGSSASPEDVIAGLHDHGIGQVILSLGANGFIVSTEGTLHHHPAETPAAITSVTGAGDALMAGFIAGIARGHDVINCGEIAARAAARTLACSGAVHPDISWSTLTGPRS